MGFVHWQKDQTMTSLQARRLVGKTIKVMYASAPEIGIRYITIICLDDDEEGVYYKLDAYSYTRSYKPLSEILVLD